MAQELFLSVQQAEEKAEQTLQAAQQKARELIKDTEAQIKAEERKASLNNRNTISGYFRKKTQLPLKRASRTRARQRWPQQKESLDDSAPKAWTRSSQMIVERIWGNGDR